MVSANQQTPTALRGLWDIQQRIERFYAQKAFLYGKPLVWENDEPIGIDMRAPTYRHRLFRGAYGCGKSYILDFTGINLSINQPGNLGMIARKRFEQLINTTMATFYEIIDEATNGDRGALICDTQDANGAIEVYLRTAGEPSKIIFRIEPDGSDEFVRDSFKGYELGWFGLDELTQLKKVTYDTLKLRLRRPGFVLAGLAASNPASPRHWMTQLIQESEEQLAMGETPNDLVLRARAFDNPYLRADYIEQLKEQYKNDPEGYDMYVLGKDGLDITGKPVFRKDFNNKIHVDPSLRPTVFQPLYVGLDFGYHNPAAVWLQRDDRDRFNVLGELHPKDVGVEEFADLVLDFNRRHLPQFKSDQIFYFGDPAGAQTTDKGDPTIVRLAHKGIHVRYMASEVNPGIEAIRQLLQKLVDGRPRLVFHPRCRELIDAFRGAYYYRQRTDGTYTDVPFKDGQYDHIVDAFRYAIVNLTLRGPLAGLPPAQAEGPRRIQLR